MALALETLGQSIKSKQIRWDSRVGLLAIALMILVARIELVLLFAAIPLGIFEVYHRSRKTTLGNELSRCETRRCEYKRLFQEITDARSEAISCRKDEITHCMSLLDHYEKRLEVMAPAYLPTKIRTDAERRVEVERCIPLEYLIK